MPAAIVSSSVGNSDGQVTSLPCVLPTGLSVGQKLLLAVSAYIATPPPVPSGWSLVKNMAGGCPTFLYERVVDGTEGPTVAVSLGRPAGAAYACYAIQDWDTGADIEYGTLQGVGGTVSPNPLPVTPSWGTIETLFIPVFGWRWGSNGPSSILVNYPSDYSDYPVTDICDIPRGTGIAMCAHSHDLGEDNPGAALLSGVSGTTCITLAIK